MTMIENFVKERNEALFSLDRRKIEAYLVKYGEGETAKAPDLLFWASVYKAICGIKGAPRDVLEWRKPIPGFPVMGSLFRHNIFSDN